MQYMRDMFSGRGQLPPLDNVRYPELKWTTARDFLEKTRPDWKSYGLRLKGVENTWKSEGEE
ncbi:hypothetical protein DESA109040_09425 [Deinococcus saxicola]